MDKEKKVSSDEIYELLKKVALGEFDYVSYATSPDGRQGDYKYWGKESKECNRPAEKLDDKLYKTMVAKFRNAK